jgi:hypothetical protein
MTIIDPKLREFANDVQRKHFDAYVEHGSYQKAARALGLKSKNAVQDSIARLIKGAALKGYSPEHDMTRTVPDGFKVKGCRRTTTRKGSRRGSGSSRTSTQSARLR